MTAPDESTPEAGATEAVPAAATEAGGESQPPTPTPTPTIGEPTEASEEPVVEVVPPVEVAASEEAPPRHRWWHTSFAAAVGALAFGALSLTPSLLPRSGLVQGLVTGVGIAVGYGFGVLVAWVVRQFTGRAQPWPGNRLAWQVFGAVAAVVAVIALVSGKQSQDDLHRLMSMSPPSASWYPVTLVLAALVALLLIGISRAIRHLAHWVARGLAHIIPVRTARALGVIAAAVVTVLVLNGVLLNGLLNVLDTSFKARNASTAPGVEKTTSAYVSGGPSSEIPWDDLGRQGRTFIGGVTPTADLTAFNGTQAVDPIRVYVGLESADTAEKRAQLAVAELVRLGAFNRKVLAIGTTTGTGWVDENAVKPLEYMYNGDTAIVATQYSYLPSWLSFLVDKKRAKAAGVTLFDAVYGQWLKEPPDSRPKLVIFGESLGSFGGEAAFSGLQDMVNRTSGAVFSGPPNTNTLWRRYTSERDAGSPEVLPIYQQGQTLRWAQVPSDLDKPTGTWQSPRVMYLQNASDPITWWAPRLLTSRPDWLKEPHGRDVLSGLHWIPVLTFFQVTADMMDSTGVPDGHGHKYGTNQVWAWASVLQPPGWTQAKTDALMTKLAAAEG